MNLPHYHDTYEFYLQVSGKRKLIIDDISYLLSPGDLYIIKPFEVHISQTLDHISYERFVVNLSPLHLKSILTPIELTTLFNPFKSCFIHLAEHDLYHIYAAFHDILESTKRNGFLKNKLIEASLLKLLLLIRDYMEHSTPIEGALIHPEISKAIQYMSKHYQSDISLDSIASEMHISKYYFSRLFRKTTGETFLQHLQNIRLAHAHEMLVNSNLSLKEISLRAGFSSEAQFSRVFFNHNHISPRDFKRTL